MVKDKTHYELAVRLERGPEGARLVIGPSAAGVTFVLGVPGVGVAVRVCRSAGGKPYVGFRLPDGSFHFFTEVEAKAAAKDCLGLGQDVEDRHTRTFCEQAWELGESV